MYSKRIRTHYVVGGYRNAEVRPTLYIQVNPNTILDNQTHLH